MPDIHIIAVSQKQMARCKLETKRLRIDLNTALLLQIIAHPHIVIARKHYHPDTLIGHTGQSPQDSDKALRNDPAIFEPKVEYVAKQEHPLGRWFYGIEPLHETTLYGTRRSLIACAQMYIRCKVVSHWDRLEELLQLFFERRAIEVLTYDTAIAVDKIVGRQTLDIVEAEQL